MRYLFVLVTSLLLACNGGGETGMSDRETSAVTDSLSSANSIATLAGGCFWCIEAPFEKVPGVVEVISGYTGGEEKNPTYREVASGSTGHTEAVQIHFDSTVVSYGQLLDFFLQQFDPTDAGGSFVDRGSQYRSGIFYHSEDQKKAAEEALRGLEESGLFDKPVVTPIEKFDTFYPAEDYHQDYYKKSPERYNSYRSGSGRDQFINEIWGTGGRSGSQESGE